MIILHILSQHKWSNLYLGKFNFCLEAINDFCLDFIKRIWQQNIIISSNVDLSSITSLGIHAAYVFNRNTLDTSHEINKQIVILK